jgi:hypothetical protein
MALREARGGPPPGLSSLPMKTPAADFAGMPTKTLKVLATRVKKLKQGYKISEAIEVVAGRHATPQAVVCHLVAAGLLDPMPNGALLEYLANADLDEGTADAVAEALARRDEEGRGVELRTSSLSWMESWPEELDRLVFRAHRVAPAAFAARSRRFAAATGRGLAFVACRAGGEVEPARASEVLDALAQAQATGYGITVNSDCPVVDDAGREAEHRVGDLAALRSLALRIGPAAEWDRALAAATLRNEWGLGENVASALERLPLDALTRVFATRARMFGDSSGADASVAAIMDRRADPPAALRAALAHAPASEHDAARLRAVYAAAADRAESGGGAAAPVGWA